MTSESAQLMFAIWFGLGAISAGIYMFKQMQDLKQYYVVTLDQFFFSFLGSTGMFILGPTYAILMGFRELGEIVVWRPKH